MTTYALLVLPAANRVYGKATTPLLEAELSAVFGDQVSEVASRMVAGVPYVTFDAAGVPDAIGDLSAAYALFELSGQSMLRPVEMRRRDRLDDDLLTIQRYQGKTNEQFTKLLVNVALAAVSEVPSGRPVRLLDPLCGRGTTLNQGLVYGFDVAGVDTDGRAIDAYETFLVTWLKDKRLKHKVEKARIRRDGKVAGRRFDVSGDVRCTVVHDDSRFVAEHFRKPWFDLLVADLPYGVQHSRRPVLDDALPAWLEVLRRGGAMALAFNTRVTKRASVVAALAAAGLTVFDDGPFTRFEHRVDQAIQRDVVVARVPSAHG